MIEQEKKKLNVQKKLKDLKKYSKIFMVLDFIGVLVCIFALIKTGSITIIPFLLLLIVLLLKNTLNYFYSKSELLKLK